MWTTEGREVRDTFLPGEARACVRPRRPAPSPRVPRSLAGADLRHRITIEKLRTSIDAYGSPTQAWSDRVADLPAAFETPQVGREQEAAAGILTSQGVVFRIRYDATVDPADRVRFDGSIYRIESLQDPDGQRRELRIIAELQA